MLARSNLMISLLVNVTSEVDFDQNSLLFKETLYFRMADEMKQLFPEFVLDEGKLIQSKNMTFISMYGKKSSSAAFNRLRHINTLLGNRVGLWLLHGKYDDRSYYDYVCHSSDFCPPCSYPLPPPLFFLSLSKFKLDIRGNITLRYTNQLQLLE
jgi:hypothetical protein